MRAFSLFAACVSLIFLQAPSQAQQSVSAEEAREIAREAYVYAYPLVLMEVTRRTSTNVAEPSFPAAPVNQLAHARAFPDASFTVVVRPNADTLYTVLTFDVSQEPLVVSVPDSDGRYFLLPWLDYWTDIFACPGRGRPATKRKPSPSPDRDGKASCRPPSLSIAARRTQAC
jgi:hypothetical protein